jgi:BlaI family penicillinase repressor
MSEQSLSTVRTHLRNLELKGVVRHRRDGKRFVYSPAIDGEVAGREALKAIVLTYYRGSVEAVLEILNAWREDPPSDEYRS